MTDTSSSANSTVFRLAHAMLWGALWPTAVVAVAAVVVAGWLRGVPGVVGAVIGIALVVLCSGLGIAVMRWTARSHPMAVMSAAMFSFVGKLGLLLIFLLVFRGTTLFDVRAFGFTLLAGTIAWTIGEAVGFARARVLVVEP